MKTLTTEEKNLHFAKTEQDSKDFEDRSKRPINVPKDSLFLTVKFMSINSEKGLVFGYETELLRRFSLPTSLIVEDIEFNKEKFIYVKEDQITFLTDPTTIEENEAKSLAIFENDFERREIQGA